MDVRCPACGDPQATELNTGRDWYVACCSCDFTAGPLPVPPDEASDLSDLLLSDIPIVMVSALVDAMATARELACQGRFALGYDELVKGLRWANERLGRKHWAAELAARYRLAIDRYCLQFGVDLRPARCASGG
jgi:hypothetical protein